MPFDAAKYLEECASACPYCGRDDQMRRCTDATRFRREPDARPVLAVLCWCAACGRDWVESYRLESVEPCKPKGLIRG